MSANRREPEPALESSPVSEGYWRRSRRLGIAVVATWVGLAVLLPMASKYMEVVAVLSIPLGYYLGSHGGLILVALLLLLVVVRQNRVDRATGRCD